MDIETIATVVVTVIAVASALVPILYKVSELTETKKDDKIVEKIDKGLKIVIEIAEVVGLNKIAKKQEQKKKEASIYNEIKRK